MTLAQLQELAVKSAAGVDELIAQLGERCVVIVVLCGEQPGSPLAVGSNVLPSCRPGLVKNLHAAALAVEGT